MERAIFLNALNPDSKQQSDNSIIESNVENSPQTPTVRSITGSNKTSSAYFKAQRNNSNRARSQAGPYYRSNQHKNGSNHTENSESAPYQNSYYSNNSYGSNTPYTDVSNPPFNYNPYQVTYGYEDQLAESSYSTRSNQRLNSNNPYQAPPEEPSYSNPSNSYNPYQVSYGYDEQPEENSRYRYNRGRNKSHKGRGNY